MFDASRDLFSRLGDDGGAAIAENWAAQMLRDVGKIAEARKRLTAQIETAEARSFLLLLPPGFYWLGMNDYSQGQFSESASHLRTALRWAAAQENTFEIQHAEDALTKNYAKIGELHPALIYAGKRFSDESLYYRRGLNQYWRDKGTLAELTLKLNFPSTSSAFAREALAFAESHSFDDVRVNDSLRHVIEAEIVKGNLDSALRYANRSLELAARRDDELEGARVKAEIHRLLGDINRQAHNCTDALADYDLALAESGRLPEITIGAYQIHKGRLDCFRQTNRQDQFAAELKIVMNLTDEYRQKIREDSSRQAFFAGEREVFDSAIQDAIERGDARGAFALVEDSKARSLLQFVESQKSIAEVENSFASVAKPLSLNEVQARLPPNVEAIQYAVLPDRLAVWTISQTHFELTQQSVSAAELEKLVANYQTQIINKASAAEVRSAAIALYKILIPSGIERDKHLCLLPDKFLHQLSFATLVSADGKYLLEDHVLVYGPSASILILATENAKRRSEAHNERILSIGNPDFDRDANPNLPDLPDAEAESRTIASLYQRADVLLNAAATKERFMAGIGNAEVIHFAGHFLANRAVPASAKLLLAGGDLRSAELGSKTLPKAKLVVLSACETAFERFNLSEGGVGIARTFLAMGAPLVIASQWKVDSATTRDLMIAFHRHRKEKGLPTAESLRQAQLEALQSPATESPFYWAAFSLYGGFASY